MTVGLLLRTHVPLRPGFPIAPAHDTMSVAVGPATDADAAGPRRVLIAMKKTIRMDLAEMLREGGDEGRRRGRRRPEAVELAEPLN